MERLTKNDVKLGFVDSSTLPNYTALYERLREYEIAEEQGLLVKLSKPIDMDLFKALRCLASQNAYENKGECHMDLWNRTHKDEAGYTPMKCGNFEGCVCCPFYQTTYGTCFENGEHEEWLRNLADVLRITI